MQMTRRFMKMGNFFSKKIKVKLECSKNSAALKNAVLFFCPSIKVQSVWEVVRINIIIFVIQKFILNLLKLRPTLTILTLVKYQKYILQIHHLIKNIPERLFQIQWLDMILMINLLEKEVDNLLPSLFYRIEQHKRSKFLKVYLCYNYYTIPKYNQRQSIAISH